MNLFAIPDPQEPDGSLAQAHRLFEHCVEDRRESPGEELITCNTSVVAACWANASSSR